MCDYCFLHETRKTYLQDKISYARNTQISCQLRGNLYFEGVVGCPKEVIVSCKLAKNVVLAL